MSDASAMEPILDECDVRAIVRLMSEVAALPGDHVAKKARLMQGVCTLIDADKWAWAHVCDIAADRPPITVSFMHGGFTEEQFAHFLMALEHPDTRRTNSTLIEQFQTEPKHITRLREQIDPENIALRAPSARLWEAAEIHAVIMSVRPVGATSQTSIGLYRGPSRPHFTARESRIAHIILSEVGWLHEQGWPSDHLAITPQLSPRQRITLNLLLEGQSRKEIAGHMGISINTVAGYAKDVFRHFGVQSQSALMHRFRQGDGGDKVRRTLANGVSQIVSTFLLAQLPDWVAGDVGTTFL